MKKRIIIILSILCLCATAAAAGLQHLDMRLGMSLRTTGWYIYIDNANHYMIIDGVGHRLKISER